MSLILNLVLIYAALVGYILNLVFGRGVANWDGSQVALRAVCSLCGGLWRGVGHYCCWRPSEGLCDGLRAF